MTQAVYLRGRAVPSPFAHLVRARFRNEILAVAVALLVIQFFPGGVSSAVWASGLVSGATLVLNALAVVLVYRANRFINFSQLAVGATGATVFTGLIQGQDLLRGTRHVCGCVSLTPGKAVQTVNFVLCVVIAVAVVAVLSYVIYRLFIAVLFRGAPRLTLMLVTIFLGQAIYALQSKITGWLLPKNFGVNGLPVPSTNPPYDFSRTLGGYTLHLREVLLVVFAVLTTIGISTYLRRSETGVTVRAASENPDRAATLAINVGSVTARVWLLAGLACGIAGVLNAFGSSAVVNSSQGATSDPIDAVGLTLVLTCVVAAQFRSLTMAALAGLTIGVVQTATQVDFSSAAPLDAALVFVVGALLLGQKPEGGRAGADDFSGTDVAQELRPIPAVLRQVQIVRSYISRGLVLLTVVVLGAPWTLSIVTINKITDFMILALVGFSLLVLTGWSGQVSLGQFGFAAIGAWTASVSNLPFPLAILLGGVAGSAVAAVVGIPALKLKDLHLAVVTLAFSVSASTLFIDPRYLGKHLPAALPGASLVSFSVTAARPFYYVVLVIVLLAAGAILGMRRTRTGRVLIAVRANEASAAAFGINVVRARLTAFAVSGFLSAVAGGLLAFHLGHVVPESFAPGQSIIVFTYTVIGGVGGLAGPVLGFVFYGAGHLATNNQLLTYVASGIGGVLLLVVAPGGLAQTLYGVRDAGLRRVAVRLRIPVPSLMGDGGAAMLSDRAPMDDRKDARRTSIVGAPLYKLPRQWALDRYSHEAETVEEKERVGG